MPFGPISVSLIDLEMKRSEPKVLRKRHTKELTETEKNRIWTARWGVDPIVKRNRVARETEKRLKYVRFISVTVRYASFHLRACHLILIISVSLQVHIWESAFQFRVTQRFT